MYAVRNIRLCTKDCLCLYVCPTGASNTENSVIDREKCIGCGRCAAACPSHAISMVPEKMPPQQIKDDSVVRTLRRLIASKNEAENIAASLGGPLAAAIRRSSRIMAEDLAREAGYMLPQSGNAHALLRKLSAEHPEADFPSDAVSSLLVSMENNDAK